MSASASRPVPRGVLLDLGEMTLWVSNPYLRASRLHGDDRALIACELVHPEREHVEAGPGAALIRSTFGPMLAIHIGPGPVFRVMKPEEAPWYLAADGAVAIDRVHRIDVERWAARRKARVGRA